MQRNFTPLLLGRKADALERAYLRFARPEYIHPDPLEIALAYSHPHDREVAGLIAASLAFGNVKTILTSAREVLRRLEEPQAFVRHASPREMHRALSGFRHRYTTGADMADLLIGVRQVYEEHGSIECAMRSLITAEDQTIVPAVQSLVDRLNAAAGRGTNYLIPAPRRGSACKRLFMYMRWMVRRDAVDPGVWAGISPRLLVVPMDTHMHRMALRLGLTRRKQANLAAALEVTDAFRAIRPEDPVRYDFALTRFGIHPDLNESMFEIQAEAG